MSNAPSGNASKAAFALCAVAGAIPGILVAVALMTTVYDGWALLGILLGVPLGVWASTTVADRHGWRGGLLVLLVVVFAIVVFARWFTRD
jgi:hypothetical protein